MRTRTLLLLAVACGLAILVAGVVQLLRIADENDDVETHAPGEAVVVGDLTVVVDAFQEAAGTATVDVRLGGVADDDGAAEFRLVLPGESLRAVGRDDNACLATTVEEQACTLTFDVGDAAGGSRILLYRRGDDIARWELARRP